MKAVGRMQSASLTLMRYRMLCTYCPGISACHEGKKGDVSSNRRLGKLQGISLQPRTVSKMFSISAQEHPVTIACEKSRILSVLLSTTSTWLYTHCAGRGEQYRYENQEDIREAYR